MPASPWSKSQRLELKKRYRQLRIQNSDRFDARKKFPQTGADVLHWYMEAHDWTKHSTQLLDLFDTFEKEDKETPVPTVPVGDAASNAEAMPLPNRLNIFSYLYYLSRRTQDRRLALVDLEGETNRRTATLLSAGGKPAMELMEMLGRIPAIRWWSPGDSVRRTMDRAHAVMAVEYANRLPDPFDPHHFINERYEGRSQ